MLDTILKPLIDFIVNTISKSGYAGIALLMGLESVNIPIPSEVIMPFSGFLVSQGKLNFWWTSFFGAFGCLLGSIASYALGYFGGETLVRKVIKKYGKYVLVFEYELDEAGEWFRKYGDPVTFFSRMLPVIRTFISLPAGIAKMNFSRFCFFAFVGSFIWSVPLTYVGKILGENWGNLGKYFHKFDIAFVVVFFLTVIWYVRHKLKKHRAYKNNSSDTS